MPQMVEAGLQIIRDSEGLRLQPYQDAGGLWTQGYGHTHGINADSPDITEETANDWLGNDTDNFGELVLSHIHVPLNDNQYSALVSLTFNEGTAPLIRTLGQKLNAGDYDGAANEFAKWVYCNGKILDGLVTRRDRERRLFIS